MTPISPMTREEGLSRRKNSLVIGLVLFALVALFYAVTVVRLQGNVAKRLSLKPMANAQSEQSGLRSKTEEKSSGTSSDRRQAD